MSDLNVIDLFAGVGGLSLGAARAGFNVAAAIELDKYAYAAHCLNFPETTHIQADISTITHKTLIELSGLEQKDIHGIIGGPPCQGFSTIGKRAADDPRNNLFSKFFFLVKKIKPAFYLAENVPGILAARNDKIRTEALAQIPKNYIQLDPILVKASDYGSPTIRTRVFFIGYDPKRCSTMNATTFKPTATTKKTTVRQAFTGLPDLGDFWETDDGILAIDKYEKTPYGSRLNGAIPRNVGHRPSIRALANHGLVSGFLPTRHTAPTIERFKIVQPGKSDSISKCPRLDFEGFCPTLRAGTGSDKGSFQAVRPIHPLQPRVINPREAARLQGFPDWFQFTNTKWQSFRQIGNSVSPIVAEEILSKIMKSFSN
jgi:DNA (cytosine-5)-methyltransferase 1